MCGPLPPPLHLLFTPLLWGRDWVLTSYPFADAEKLSSEPQVSQSHIEEKSGIYLRSGRVTPKPKHWPVTVLHPWSQKQERRIWPRQKNAQLRGPSVPEDGLTLPVKPGIFYFFLYTTDGD